jgi:hypothetical protein
LGNIGSDRYWVARNGDIAIAAFVRSLPRDQAFLLDVAGDAVQTAFKTTVDLSAPRTEGDEIAVNGVDGRTYWLLPMLAATGGVHSLRIRQA